MGWVETPYPSPQDFPLPQANYPSRTSLGETSLWPPNLDQRSWFWHKMIVESISGQRALLYEVRQLSRRPAQVNQRASLKGFSEALQENQAEPVQPGQIHGRPVRGKSWYKGDHCTSSPLSINTRRWPHLQTHREETLLTRSEEEQTVVKTLQAKQLRRSSSLRL